MEERSREQEVVTQAWVELRRLAAQSGNADGVFEKTAGVAVVPLCARGGKRTEQRAKPDVGQDARPHRSEPGVRDLADQKLEEPIELICVTAHCRGQVRGVGIRRSLDSPYLHLQLW